MARGAVDGLMAGPQRSDDRPTDGAYPRTNRSSGSLASGKPVVFPSGCGDACARPGSDCGTDKRVADPMTTLHERHAAHVRSQERLRAARCLQRYVCAGETHQGAGDFLVVQVHHLNFASGADGTQVLPGRVIVLGENCAWHHEDANQDEEFPPGVETFISITVPTG